MSRHGGSQSERDFLTKIAVGAGIVITWFLVTLAAELLGNQANETDVGQSIGQALLTTGIVLVPLIALTWAGIKLWKWRHPAPPEPPTPTEATWPAEPEPAAWRPPGPIYDRDGEVEAVKRSLLGTGVAVVSGARDVGTSAVAEAAVQSLIDANLVRAQEVAHVDLRSRSSRTPDDARATAGRILSMFRQDEPANGTPAVLANAAKRLHDVLAGQYSVLLLDNVAVPEEIAWLIPQWTGRNGRRPWLVIAGEAAIRSVAPGSQVRVGPLSTDGMRRIWYADTDTAPSEPAPPPATGRRPRLPRWLRDLLRPPPEQPQPTQLSTSDPIDKLVDACRGRPRAIKAVARDAAGPDCAAKVDTLLASMDTDRTNPLVGVWRAILLRTESGLSPDAAWLLHALAVIPVTGLAKEEVAALVTAHDPAANTGTGDALPAPLEELRVRDFVAVVRDRYRLPLEIRLAVIGRAPERDVETARVAVPALVRHHADRAARRANQLDKRSVGEGAAKWLHDEEPTLRPLFSPKNYQDREVRDMVIDDLARIAGALEHWYVREQQADGLLTVSENFGEVADLAERYGLSALAAARRATAHRMRGEPEQADKLLCLVEGEARRTTDHALSTELVTRVRVERAMLSAAGDQPAPDDAERSKARRELEETAGQRRHPGAGIAMLNLGALHLAEKAYDEALTWLDRAEAMAGERGDTGCQAQAVELRGVALAGQDLGEAVSLWQEALQLFESIGDEQGQARCLQHLGAAALVDEAAAARLSDDATSLLRTSKRLRAGQPDTALVDEYLRAAENTS